MKLTILLELEEGERVPKMLDPKDVEKFKSVNPGLEYISNVTIYPDEQVEVYKDGRPTSYFNRN